ncbi:MAG: hypothetical protein IJ112_02245 [Oscillospiraceae bacterium]|nr:hypothetical protein [Oscillospiraceae bacterium]
MADRVVPGPVESTTAVREAVCIHTRKIYQTCRDKDCIEDLRVFPTRSSQEVLESAFSVRPRAAELLLAQPVVNEVSFNRGYYTVDVSYYYRVTGEALTSGEQVTGLAIFDKRVLLFGSEASAKVFASVDDPTIVNNAGLPIAVVESVDPIALRMNLVETETPPELEQRVIPDSVQEAFDEPLVLTGEERSLYVTLGQFSMIRLERDTQLLIPAYDYCVPQEACEGSGEEDPCAMFSRIQFPIDEFFPPDSVPEADSYRSLK